MTTKIPAELSSTPGIVDNSNATALTINSSENAKFEGLVGINKDINASVALSVGADATSTTSYGLEVTNSTAATRFLVNGEGSSIFYKTDNAEGMRFNASTGGLTFGGDTAAANTLDDYEEGTWTPATNGTGVGITTYTATYTKIGDLVMYRCYIQIGVNSAGDAATISGLPFTNGGSNFWCAGSIWENNAKQPYVLVSDGGSDTIQLRQNSNGASHPYSDFSNTQIIITGTYKTLQ